MHLEIWSVAGVLSVDHVQPSVFGVRGFGRVHVDAENEGQLLRDDLRVGRTQLKGFSLVTQSPNVVVCIHLSLPSTSLTALLLQFIDPPQYVSQVGIVFFVDGEGEMPQSQRFRPVFVN